MPRRSRSASVREIEVPVPDGAPAPEELLEAKLGSREASDRLLAELAGELGLPPDAPKSVLSAVALAKLGGDVGSAAGSLKWDDFERFCAVAISASGFRVRRNVRLRKPTRQIDIVAESPSIVLVVDCKHWRRGAGPASLEAVAAAQAERTRILAARTGSGHKPHLPVILTVVDNQLRAVRGVPIVPVHALKDFLGSVEGFGDDLAFVTG